MKIEKVEHHSDGTVNFYVQSSQQEFMQMGKLAIEQAMHLLANSLAEEAFKEVKEKAIPAIVNKINKLLELL